MKLDKRYIKFFETGDNRYYLLPVQDELHIVTESILPMQKRFLCFKRNKNLVQGIKLLELTAPLSMLFQEVISADVEKEDEDFPDMTTYKKIDNISLRTNIENTYKKTLDMKIFEMQDEFEMWLSDLAIENPNMSEEDFNNIEKANRVRLEENIKTVKTHSPLNFLSFKWKNGENLIVKKMLDNNMEFLYSQKIGSNYKIYYLYEVVMYGIVIIYKIHCVKDIVKKK